MLTLIAGISTIVPRIVHVIGVVRWIMPRRDVAQVVILGMVTAVMAGIILGDVSGHGWRMNRPRSGNAACTDSSKAGSNSTVRRVVNMSVDIRMLTNEACMGMFLVGSSIFDFSGVEGVVGGVG